MAPSYWSSRNKPPQKPKKKHLPDKILERSVESKFDHDKSFLPAGIIDELVTRESIIMELEYEREVTPGWPETEPTKDIIDFVYEEAKIVFATTVISGLRGENLEWAMFLFKEINFIDSSLPVKKGDLEEFFRKPDSPWSILESYNFRREQWRFLAPVFSRENFKVDLEPEHILPFIKKDIQIREGAFGQVFQVDIHPAHQKDPIKNDDGTSPKFAIKELKLSAFDSDLRKDAEDVWSSEVNTLDEINDLSHPNLIQRIVSITRGSQRLLVFLWADGGNLRDFWVARPEPKVTVELVKEIIGQIRGMAGALDTLHNFKAHEGKKDHFRHGDIKPENILIFPDPNKARLGNFKISDLGSAKRHSVVTQLRKQTKGKAFATVVYQPPESLTRKLQSSSRLYDIWSMGCVTMEFMIWLLYGNEVLESFSESINGFFETEKVDNNVLVAHIHPAVRAWLDHLSQDQECKGETALGDLLKIIKTKLLVIQLPEESESENVSIRNADADDNSAKQQQSTAQRANAKEFVNALDDIFKRGENANNESYWFTGRSRDNVRLPRGTIKIVTEDHSSSLLKPPPQGGPLVHRKKGPSSPDGLIPFGDFSDEAQNIKDRVQLSDDWSYPVDNDFANRLLRDTRATITLPDDAGSAHLCGKCEKMNFWASAFRIEDTWSELESRLKTCDFCKIRFDIAKSLDRKDYTSISFDRIGSTLRMNDDNSPVLSICRAPDLSTIIPIQIGFPQLPEAGSRLHFQILRQWLKNCDENHNKFKCRPKSKFVPTRLIDVGRTGSATIHLCEKKETKFTHPFKYIALSHPWGSKPPYFCTFQTNVEEHKKKIAIADLPSTFGDAVSTTRELGLQYLWIDSICIVQGVDGDFEQEAKYMENVFSSAYCVLAASSAKSQSEGFLNERESREVVTFKRDGQPPFYVCRLIDDFKEHVLESPLSQRGWVMQEKVLAHRTIYFTNKQTYWECGECVRCETLTRMENKLSSFLGDPNFPEKITSKLTNRGTRIIFYQNLYQQYSRLAFTRWEDRPIAILGLEKRLIYDLQTQGGFGAFDDGQSLLRRSLLWQRGCRKTDLPTLEKITFPPERKIIVPTWSWMAYKGGIDFLEMPLGGMIWHKDEIKPPWIQNMSEGYHTTDKTRNIELSAVARDFNNPSPKATEFEIIRDIPEAGTQLLKCVVVGRRSKDGESPDARHYVLFITPKEGTDEIYERVGVGFMPGRLIDMNASGASRLVKIR